MSDIMEIMKKRRSIRKFLTTPVSKETIVELIKANLDKLPVYSVGFEPPVDGYSWVPVGILNKLEKNAFTNGIVLNLNKEAFSRFALKDFGADFGYTQLIPEHIKELYYLSLVGVGNDLLARGLVSESQEYFTNALMLLKDKYGAFIGLGNSYMKLSDCEGAKAAYFKAYGNAPHNVEVLEDLVRFYKDCAHDDATATIYSDKANFEKQKGESKFR